MKSTLLLVSLFLIPWSAFADASIPTVSCKPSNVPLFNSDSILNLTLKANFPITNVPTTGEIKYQDLETNENVSIPLQLVGRGKSRSGCNFRPIRILWGENKKDHFKKTLFKNTKGQDMKLTAHCRYSEGTIQNNLETNEYVIKEYMVYKLLKAFGLPSFDVRLAKMQYLDQTGREKVEGYGFFIESSAQLAKRCDTEHVKKNEMDAAIGPQMNKQIYIPYMFSRLISDASDFIISHHGTGHNTEAFYNDEKIAQFFVAYDFNDSGLVNSGIVKGLSFSPHFTEWFKLLRKGPFTHGREVMPLSTVEQNNWKMGLVAQAKQLMAHKTYVLRVIDESPLQQKSKKQFRDHIELLMKEFQKIVIDQGR